MNERINVEKHDSDTSYYLQLLYAGEQLLKLVTSALVCAIDDDKADSRNNQYALNYTLVHGDSLGYWVGVLENIITGPAHRFIRKEYEPILEELSVKNVDTSWQFRSLTLLNECIKELKEDKETLKLNPTWFSDPLKSPWKIYFHLFSSFLTCFIYIVG